MRNHSPLEIFHSQQSLRPVHETRNISQRPSYTSGLKVDIALKIMGLLGSLFEKASPATAQQLLAYAVDKTADLGGRDDAVLELSAYDLAEVESALLRMAGDEAEEEMLVDQAGHALWIIWSRQGRVPPPELVARMLPSAKKFFAHDL